MSAANAVIGATVTAQLGRNFEREIREQPAVWERLARSDAAAVLAAAVEDDVLLIGSGSSLFAAQLGAIALRRRGIKASAVAATEAPGDHLAYEGRVVVAISQSGRSSDVLRALDAAEITIAGLALREPSLDDVFLSLTGHKTTIDDEVEEVAKPRRGLGRSRRSDVADGKDAA